MRRSSALLLAFLAVALLGCVTAQGNITLAKIFSDHMVLQRNSSVKVWGVAKPNTKLVVTFNGQTANAIADIQGRWSTAVKTPDAGGPYELEVADEDGDTKVVISDVMIGEVWICSGQSNMEWPVSKAMNAETEIEQSKNYPNLRLFTIGKEASTQLLNDLGKVTPWDCCSPETVKDFSAVAYFYGRELSDKLDMPIGLVNASWGGSRCEAWTSRGAMDSVAELAPLLRHWDESDDLTNPHRPANLYNSMIAPLSGFKFRGVIWYQGEANVGRGDQYSVLFPTLIKSWRNALANDEEFPFYYVQLAPFRYEGRSKESLPEVWDAQRKTMKVANVGMVVTTDVGLDDDIHPPNKQVVGRRLSLWALANTYAEILPDEQKVTVFSGPVYESIATNKSEIRVTFTNAKGGLVARDDEPLTDFVVCGEDRVFHPATAAIDGEAVVVSSPEVEKPVAVRFGWSDTSSPNLVNKAGLPATPFRTDDFDLESKGVEF